jgi:hypothetical protein
MEIMVNFNFIPFCEMDHLTGWCPSDVFEHDIGLTQTGDVYEAHVILGSTA